MPPPQAPKGGGEELGIRAPRLFLYVIMLAAVSVRFAEVYTYLDLYFLCTEHTKDIISGKVEDKERTKLLEICVLTVTPDRQILRTPILPWVE